MALPALDASARSMAAANKVCDREMKFMPVWRLVMRLFPKKKREELKRMSGFVLLERNDVTSMFPTPVRSRPAVP